MQTLPWIRIASSNEWDLKTKETDLVEIAGIRSGGKSRTCLSALRLYCIPVIVQFCGLENMECFWAFL